MRQEKTKQKKHKKERTIVMGGTKDLAFAMATLLMSLIEKNPSVRTDIIIYHNGISKKEQEAINSIYPCIFRCYQSPFAEVHNWKQGIMERFTDMVFVKYECLRLLEEYRTVVWLDYDMLIEGDLNELFVPVEGGLRLILSQTLADQVMDNIKNSELKKYAGAVGVHSSTMAFYDSLPDYMSLYRWCIDVTKRYADDLGTPEQVVFTLMIHKFQLPVYPLQFQLYSPHPKDRGTLWDAYVKIWHTYGKEKYWTSIEDIRWNRLYRRYQELLGREEE